MGYRKTKNGKYEAYVSESSKYKNLGTYETEDQANDAIKQYVLNRLKESVYHFGHNLNDGIKYGDHYIVFSNGDIFNVNGHKMTPHINRDGYLQGIIYGKSRLYHRIIAECFIPNPEGKHEVNHINGIKNDNRVANLEWVTRSENIIHAYRTGLENKQNGEKHHAHKLTEDDVHYIRRSDKSSYTLAKELNVDSSTIRDVRLGRTWRHIDD